MSQLLVPSFPTHRAPLVISFRSLADTLQPYSWSRILAGGWGGCSGCGLGNLVVAHIINTGPKLAIFCAGIHSHADSHPDRRIVTRNFTAVKGISPEKRHAIHKYTWRSASASTHYM